MSSPERPSEHDPATDSSSWLPQGPWGHPTAGGSITASPPAPAARALPNANRSVARMAAALAVGVAAGIGLSAAVSDDSTDRDQATTASTAEFAAAQAARAIRDPFGVNGARWAVFPNPTQLWTTLARRQSPGAGRRWVFVSLRIRNLTRPDLDPAVLPYRLIDRAGQSYTPSPGVGSGPLLGRRARVLDIRELTNIRLAFSVPVRAEQPVLTFTTKPTGGQTVVVPLGAV